MSISYLVLLLALLRVGQGVEVALTSKDPSVSNCPSTKGSQNTWETINTKDTSRYRKAMELLPELYSTRSEKDSNDAPAPPSDVVAKASYGCSPAIIVSWGHPEDMSWIDEYIISCTASLKETITNIRSSRDSKIEMQVDPGKSYVCSVASKGPHGQSAMVAASPVAYSFALACPPSQPTNVQASVSSSCPPEIHISWSAPDTDVEPIMYEVTCRGESKVSRVRVKAPVTSAMLGVDESVEYLCEVVSMSLSGTSNATYAPSSVMVSPDTCNHPCGVNKVNMFHSKSVDDNRMQFSHVDIVDQDPCRL